MKIEKVLVTPEIAAQWLANNSQNRNVNKDRVNRYAADMINNKWRNNTGEFVKIAKDGTLLDGQHRLIAVIKAKKTVELDVLKDLENDLFQVLDTGKSRNASDILKIAGIKNATTVSGLINKFHMFMNTNVRNSSSTFGNNLSGHEMLSFYNSNKEWIDDNCTKSHTFYAQFQKVWNHGEVALFYSLLTHADKRLGHDFIRELCQGTDITNDSIILLRNRLIAEKISNTKKSLNAVTRALVIKTWNAYYLGKTIKSLKFNPEIEEYPAILGLDKD
jgi:hypothetical protein